MRLASCWRVAVVNGGYGLRFDRFSRRLTTVKVASANRARSASARSRSSRTTLRPGLRAPVRSSKSRPRAIATPSRAARSAVKAPPSAARCARRRHQAPLRKARRSRSRSTSRRTATDCTRPAERPGLIFFHRSGETLYPTRRSRILRACWASMRGRSISPGSLSASSTALFVISLNVMRWNRSRSDRLRAVRASTMW